MVEVYYYIPAEEVDNAVECGLKLSKWYDRETLIEGDTKKCISALLNPRDDMEKYKSENLKCLKLEFSPKYCFVGDRYLYRVGQKYPQVMEIYERSIIPVEKYKFGSYRLPECLVTSTVIPGQVTKMDRRLDSPVLFDSSERLYINNIIETYREGHDEFDVMLYCFYSKLSEDGRLQKMEDEEQGIVVFIDNVMDKVYNLKVPDISQY